MSGTGMDDFPNELLERILSVFGAESLDCVLAKVCSRWKALSESILQRRAQKIRNTLDEIKTQYMGDVSDVVLLKEYESIYMRSDYRLRDFSQSFWKYPSVARLETCAMAFCYRKTSGGDDAPNAERHSFTQMFFIECHKLIVALKDEHIIFFPQSAFFTYTMHLGDIGSYDLECMMPTNNVGCLDVYQDNLAVVKKDSTEVVLYQITNVCHNQQKLVINPLKLINFLTSIRSVTLFKDKVCVLFNVQTSLRVGVWQKANPPGETEILTSDQEFPTDVYKLHDDKYGSMTRINNLLFVRLSKKPKEPQGRSRITWMVLDMNEASLDFLEVAVGIFCGSDVDVANMKLFGNILLIERPYGSVYSQGRLLMVKVKLDPAKHHFLNYNNFKQLADLTSIFLTTSLAIRDPFIIAIPSSRNCLGETKTVFLAIGKHENFVRVSTLALYNKEERPGPYIDILKKARKSTSTVDSSCSFGRACMTRHRRY